MEDKQILLIGVIIIIAIAIVCATVVFLKVNETPKPVANQTNSTSNTSSSVSVESVNTETVQPEPQKKAYAYKSDGTPMYSYQEVSNYIYNKYGPGMRWHIQDNGYISLDTPGYTSDGRRLY